MTSLSDPMPHDLTNGPPVGMPYESSVTGFVMDGMSVGVVVYSLTRLIGHKQIGNTNAQTGVYAPEICWSYYSESSHLSEIIGRIAPLTKTIIIPGQESGTSLIGKQLKSAGSKRVVEFASAARYYTLDEVLACVLDDVRTNQITVRPEYENSPQHEDLKTHLSSIEANERKLTALQRAFVIALGHWSAIKRRPKFSGGPGPIFW